MRNLLTDQSSQVRLVTAEALALLRDAPSINAAEQAVLRQVRPLDGYIRLVGHAKLTQSVPALATVLSGNPDAASRSAAAWAIGEIGRPGMAALPSLEAALSNDADPDVRRESVVALAKFHNANTASLLQNACRIDPAVRKSALEAMADYPETIEFLVGVMNLGADLIAADELEAARNSLTRLTGQDLGMDGSRWNDWFASNRSSFPSVAGTSAGGGAAATTYSAPAVLEVATAGSGSGEVDFDRWSLVADTDDIPMALHVDAAAGSRAPDLMGAGLPPPSNGGISGMPGISGFSSEPTASGTPSMLSPSDFGGNDAGFGGGGLAGGASNESNLFRTWSSEPDRMNRSEDVDVSSAYVAPGSGDVDESMFMSGMDADALPANSSAMDDGMSTYREVSTLSGDDGMAFTAPEFSQAPDTSALPGGISLPLPGMDMGMAGNGFQPFTSSPEELDADPFGMPSDSFFPAPDDTDGFAAMDDPFATPDMTEVADNQFMTDDGFGSEPGEFLFGGDDGFTSIDESSWPDIPSEMPAETNGYEEAPGFIPVAPTSDGVASGDVASDDGYDALSDATENPRSDTDEEEKSYARYLFVEPEAGQMVVGEALFDGSVQAMETLEPAMANSAPPIQPSVVPEIAAPEQRNDLPAADAEGDTAADDDSFAPRYAPAGTPMVDTRYIVIPGSEEESGRRRGRNDGARTVEEIYRPYAQETFQPPKVSREEDDYVPPKGDVFRDPSVPLPPVRSQGTVAPGRDGNVPLLGEGMF